MSNMLRELWRGNIAPLEEKRHYSEDMEEFMKNMTTYRDAVASTLVGDQQEFFESYVDCVSEYADRVADDAFCDGFRLASKLMAEAFRKE